jgi:HD-GYP domain-containing protein (c-di-GMP phosphodiesterase class II)
MRIDDLRSYFTETAPRKILGAYEQGSAFLGNINPFVYLLLIVVLAFCVVRMRVRQKRHADRERRKKDFFRSISGKASMREMIDALTSFFREIEPDIKSLGIYVKEGSGFRLANAGAYGNDGKTGGNSASLEKYISPKTEYHTRDRYHIYTFMPENVDTVVRIVAYNPIRMEEIKSELYYLSAFLETFTRADETRNDLVKTKLVENSKAIFTSYLFHKEDYFRLVATIILKGYHLDGVRIRLPEGEVSVGDPECLSDAGKTLHLRNTDIQVKIYRRAEVTEEDVATVGKFLDLISTTIALYSTESHLANYLDFLEKAVNVFENSDAYYRGHSDRVRAVALAIGASLRLDEQRLKTLSYACKFHDIGMMGDLYDIASQSINLSEKEYGKIKYHPIIGYTITVPLEPVYPVSSIILQHHELTDGTGYPNGISSEEMSLEAKILAFSEIFIGMMSERPHRPGRTFDEALRATETFLPDRLDTTVHREFLKNRDRIEASLKALDEEKS